ncbi:hypothetical protein [Sphingobacterium sp. GVS05A]|uniref:hypothetical protein n=1 Tax=Sphingobacterium sp. GVS05A TaxID=2862679 RepID=UPI001CC01DD1|nr:hypothetical protein [Sphingobacterium sp. GVS05A]
MGYKFILIFFLCAFNYTKAQTYIQGQNVVPLTSIVNSEFLSATERLSMTQAFEIYSQRHSSPFLKKPSDLVGEFWLIDNLLIKIVSRELSATRKENFQELRYVTAPPGVSTGKHKHEYFDTIKTINNYEVFISYYYFSKTKSFLIQDKQGRYKLSGTIISTNSDIKKAEAFMGTLLNSITFK